MANQKTIRTMCPMNCHPTLCGMQVTVENNTVVRIEGDEENPDSRGFLCGRGRAAAEIIGNPQRITRPWLRDQRTADAWREVSWSEALDHIADRLKQIEPHQFGMWLGHGDAATNYGTRVGGQLSKRFAHMWGAQWWHPAMICWALGGFGLGLTGLTQVNTKEDMSAHSDLIILWGANIASQPNTARHLKAAKARGARVVTIDVRKAEASARADEALIIRPGTDAALALSLMHVIVREELHDPEFIEAHTVGFEQLCAHVQDYTPQWAADITGIDAQTIGNLARTYANTRRAVIVMGGSSMHKSQYGWQGSRAISCLPAMTGKVGIQGGGLGERHGAATFGQGLNGIEPADGNRCEAIIPNQMPAITEAMADGRVKALLLAGTNMLSSFADTNALAAALERVELIICHDLFSSDTIRECADVVLPATAWLEQVGCKMTHTHLYMMERGLEAAGECGTFSQVLRDLASRLDLDDFFPWADEEKMIDAIIEHPSTSNANFASLRADGGIRPLQVSLVGHPNLAFATPSGKIEFVSAAAAEHGLPPLPVFTAHAPDAAEPLAFRQGRTLNHFHGFYDHGQALPTLKKRGGTPTLWMAPADAGSRNIEDGAAIRVFNQRGSFAATAHVTDRIGHGCVWMRDGWRGINQLTSGVRALPDSAVDLFNYGAGQSGYDAHVDVELLA